jgi:hypothetical protein
MHHPAQPRPGGFTAPLISLGLIEHRAEIGTFVPGQPASGGNAEDSPGARPGLRVLCLAFRDTAIAAD